MADTMARSGQPSGWHRALVAERPASPRIFFLEYVTPTKRDERGRFKARSGSAFVKVPYGGVYGLAENLVRAMTTNQIERFCLRTARPREITPEVRASLTRWPEALERTSEVTTVDFSR